MRSAKRSSGEFTAQSKLIDYLSRRDHSEKELKRKLSQFFEITEINQAIQWAKDREYLKKPQELAQAMAHSLHKKKKGLNYINAYLKQKGLPTISSDYDEELRKAQELIKTKLRGKHPQDREAQTKLIRFLLSRGFSRDVAIKTIRQLQAK